MSFPTVIPSDGSRRTFPNLLNRGLNMKYLSKANEMHDTLLTSKLEGSLKYISNN